MEERHAPTTTVNFINCAQVVHISGDGNIVTIPDARILMNQQAMGTNPTVGVNVPGDPDSASSASQCSGGQPNGSPDTVVSCQNSCQVENGPAAVHVSQSNTGTCIRYAEGPPGDIELVELSQKLMILRDDWTKLGPYLSLPDHELAAAEVDERTLYNKISRLLKRWVDYDIANDRQKLARILADARSDLGRFAQEVLRKAS